MARDPERHTPRVRARFASLEERIERERLAVERAAQAASAAGERERAAELVTEFMRRTLDAALVEADAHRRLTALSRVTRSCAAPPDASACTLRAPGKYSPRSSHETPSVRRILRLVACRQARPFSIAWIVRADTPDFSARTFCVQPSAWRAARMRFMTPREPPE